MQILKWHIFYSVCLICNCPKEIEPSLNKLLYNIYYKNKFGDNF